MALVGVAPVYGVIVIPWESGVSDTRFEEISEAR